MKTPVFAVLATLPLVAVSLADAQAPTDRTMAVAPANEPDNTRTNADAANRGASADVQGHGKKDIDLTAKIRRSVMSEKGLSTYGHNVKIVSRNGMVTLNGVVKTSDEKSVIHKHAASVAGEANVVDNLKVKAD